MPTFVLIGHCGPDSYLLKNAIKRAVPDATIEFADDDAALRPHLNAGSVLVVNRLLDGSDFDTNSGIELIERLRTTAVVAPAPTAMLVSNFAEAQQAAIAAGGLQGFGKKAVNSALTADLLREAARVAAANHGPSAPNTD